MHRKGADRFQVIFTHDIITYQENMTGDDRDNQDRLMGAGFYNVEHCKMVQEGFIRYNLFILYLGCFLL